MWCLVSFFITNAVTALARSPSFFGKDAYLTKEYINAITAYGPGLGVFTPYSYVDISYDNIPFVGKIPVLGKEGTSSKLGISPFYPPQGNPSNPFPPLYRARPLPLHVPEPQDVVAVPLDEEALHGEPLFPPGKIRFHELLPIFLFATNVIFVVNRSTLKLICIHSPPTILNEVECMAHPSGIDQRRELYPFFYQVIPRDRFEELFSNLHLANLADNIRGNERNTP
uniref:COesterase domain-containing protein n=1 Tax=Angiostrongylus cantonensis TaxID=6313 RepID=A0A0K0D2K2_ANGCA